MYALSFSRLKPQAYKLLSLTWLRKYEFEKKKKIIDEDAE